MTDKKAEPAPIPGSYAAAGGQAATGPLRRVYHRVLALAGHPQAAFWLFALAFAESSVFPVPPDVLMIAMILARPERAFTYATITLAGSVLGGLAGYAIGYFLFMEIGQPILTFYGYEAKFGVFRTTYNDWGAWAVFIAGLTPFPYKVITILSGATALDPVVFIVASILSRGLRFFVVAALLRWLGAGIREFIERRLGLLFTLFAALLIGGFVALTILP